MSNLFSKRFIVVTGKGGVGKTTVAISIAYGAVNQGKRILLCLSQAPPRYNELLKNVEVGRVIRQIRPGFFAVNLDPVECREEYGHNILRNRVLHRLVFGSRIVKKFLDSIPGLSEWAMLGKATYHALNCIDGRPEYDLVIFDSASTGHGLDMLGLPWMIASSAPKGRILDEAKERIALLSDPTRCEILPVSIPDEMPINETLELVKELRLRKLHTKRIVLNMVRGKNSRNLTKILSKKSNVISGWHLPVRVAVGHSQLRVESIARLEEGTGLPVIELPFIGANGLDAVAVQRLARILSDSDNDV